MTIQAEENETFAVSADETQQRLDLLLAHRFPSYSRTYFQALIATQRVLLNGLPVKKRIMPAQGDEIEVCFELIKELSCAPEPIPLDILYEDDDLLAINKPAGMVVHPAHGHPSGTFVNALLHHCSTIPSHAIRPGIVHRLDKDTTGILLAAKTTTSHQRLVEAFASRSIEKNYLAITAGIPQDGLIDAPIGRHPTRRQEMAICPTHGRSAQTICRILATNPPLALVSLRLITGRTHQIRVHLKHQGAPVLGDPLYGNVAKNKQYQALTQYLHAHEISFSHPITGKRITLKAPLPERFQALLSSHFREFPCDFQVFHVHSKTL